MSPGACTLAAQVQWRRRRWQSRGRGSTPVRNVALQGQTEAEVGATAVDGEPSMYDLRFRGVRLLFGRAAAERIHNARVAVLGLGGVGSWVVEGLARSGFGALTLVDYDDICISNSNRQLHTLQQTVGRLKVDVMAERVKQINPECEIDVVHDFFSEETAKRILDLHKLDAVVDAIDGVADKCMLIDACRKRGIPIIVSGGLGGKTDPGQFRADDMSRAEGDGLIRRVRSTLRSRYGFPKGDGTRSRKFGVQCVYSPEKPRLDACAAGALLAARAGGAGRPNCDTVYGTFCPAAGAIGFLLASTATEAVLREAKH